MITTPNMKLCFALVAFLIQGSHAAAKKYDYSDVARIKPTVREVNEGVKVKDYTLKLDTSMLQLLMPLKENNNITALEFEVYRDGPNAGFAHRLGSGTFGGVFAGRLSTTNKAPFRVAIKIGGEYADCLTEASVMERFNHPALNKAYVMGGIPPPAHDEIQGMNRQVVVMELVKGRSLESCINKETKPWTQTLPENARISIVHQVANALEFMWANGHVHGDIAERNIMVTQDGDSYNVVLIDFGKTVQFNEVYAAPENKGRLRNDDKPHNDVNQLAILCNALGLKEHANVFPLHNKSLTKKTTPDAWKYVNEMNLRPELFAKHLMYSEGHPARQFLPGLLGYAVCRKCQGLGNLAQQNRITEGIKNLRAQIKSLRRAKRSAGRIAIKVLPHVQQQLEELTKLRCQACADLRERAPTVHVPAPKLTRKEARRERVYIANIMWRQANKTDRNPVPKDLNEYVKTQAFLEATKGHPAFTESITNKDIWKYGVQVDRELLPTVEDLKTYAVETKA